MAQLRSALEGAQPGSLLNSEVAALRQELLERDSRISELDASVSDTLLQAHQAQQAAERHAQRAAELEQQLQRMPGSSPSLSNEELQRQYEAMEAKHWQKELEMSDKVDVLEV